MQRVFAAKIQVVLLILCAGCQPRSGEPPRSTAAGSAPTTGETAIHQRLAQYVPVAPSEDLSTLSESQRHMVPLLIEAAQAIDDVFWLQAYGDKDALLSGIEDPDVRRYAEINYGPWDRFAGNEPFVDGAGAKPPGAGFYPPDMTREKLEETAAADPELGKRLLDPYTVVRRDASGGLVAVPYSEAYASQHRVAAEKLRAAARLAEHDGLRRYLELRATALLNDDYFASDMAWMDLEGNVLEIAIGPIDTFEDQLGVKAGSGAFVLIRDEPWRRRVLKYAAMLPRLQRALPVPEVYKQEEPDVDLNLVPYEVLCYTGSSNAGTRYMLLGLPDDTRVHEKKGYRLMLFKTTLRAKFEQITSPIADVLVAPDQRRHVSFDADYENMVSRLLAGKLGLTRTLDGGGSVWQALGESAGKISNAKGSVLGLHVVSALLAAGELDADLDDYRVSYLANVFRSIRYGPTTVGVANRLVFNFFREAGALTRDAAGGTYRVDPERMDAAIPALAERLLEIQGTGDAEAAAAFVERYGEVDATLKSDFAKLDAARIPYEVHQTND